MADYVRQSARMLRVRVLDELFRDPIHAYNLEDLVREVNSRIEGSSIGVETIRQDMKYMRQELSLEVRGYGRPVESYKYKDSDQRCRQLESFSEDEQNLLGKAITILSGFKAPQYQWARTFLSMVKQTKGDVDSDSCIEFQDNKELVGMNWFNPLLDACLKEERLTITYQPYGKAEQLYQVSPYWLKQYNSRWFLICKDDKYDECSHLALDRIVDVKVDATLPFRRFKGEKDTYFRHVIGVTKHKGASKVNVVLHVSPNRINYITTKPFTDFQSTPKELEDSWYEVSFRIEFNKEEPWKNKELTQTLLSFGDDVEVVEPVELREEMKKKISALAQMYED